MKLRAQHQAGFTMMEIAIAIGVIAFALVAIMGVLPSAMHMQRDNRQDTIITQDGAYLLEAIRGSAQGIPDLYTFVDSYKGVANPFTNSADLMRELLVPHEGDINHWTNQFVFRSITGPLAMRSASTPTFRYIVRSQVIRRYQNIDTNFAVTLTNDVFLADTNFLTVLTNSTYDVRLTFFWPVLPTGELAEPAQKQVFRTVMSGSYSNGFFNSTEFVP